MDNVDTSTPTGPPIVRRVDRSERLTAIDAVRGLAVFGMIAVHSLPAYDETTGEPTWTYSLAAGRASAVFAVLAGVGIAFLSRRRRQTRGVEARSIAWALAARAVTIAAIGLALGFTDSTYGVVILVAYGAMFFLAIPLIYLSTRVLAVVTVVLTVGTPLLSQVLRPALPQRFDAQLSFGLLWDDPARFLSDVMFTGEFPALVWTSYVCLGLLVGRLSLTSLRTAVTLAAAGLSMMVSAMLASKAILGPVGGRTRLEWVMAPDPNRTVDEFLTFGADGTVPTNSWWWLGLSAPHTGTPLDLLATMGSALLVLGGCLALTHVTRPFWSTVVRTILAPLAAVGSMSLTVYVGHILFVNSDFDHYGPTEGYVRQAVVIVLLALAWRATAGRGPLEGLVRAVTTRVRANVIARGHP